MKLKKEKVETEGKSKKKGIKNILKWVLIVLVACFVLCMLFSGDSDDTSTTSSSNTTEETSKTEEEVVYHIGDTISVGDLEYTVNSIDSAKTIGSEYINTEAQEMYFIVNITIKNNDDSAITVSDNYFKLLLGEKEYETDTSAALYIEDDIIYESVNPDASLTGDICFDITQETIDNKDLQLQVQTGSWGTQKGVINLY
ncbi:MAG: DUF4352 domain-containing protein [Erysipelotrichaceae bacterium]|nr:DUF4352 domain-containing protein [Erysipelotrichaceae bacterium]